MNEPLNEFSSPKAAEPAPGQQQSVSNEQFNQVTNNEDKQPDQVPVNVQTTGLYAIPSQPIAQVSNQQYYIVNQPIIIPQTNPQVLLQQQFQPANQLLSVDTKSCTKFSEQDIMSMPTIFVNDRNELTYSGKCLVPVLSVIMLLFYFCWFNMF